MPVASLEEVAGNWSRDLGGDRSSGRLPCPVQGLSSSPSSHTGIVSDVPGRLSSGSSLAARGRGDACQRSLRNRPRSGSRLLQSSLPGGEGDWRLEACDRSLSFERLRPADAVQDGNSRFGAVVCQRGGFSSFLGSEGCVLSDPDPWIIEEAVEVHVEGDSLPVQSPVLRAVDCSPGLYQSLRGGVGLGSRSRDSTAPLPGRLVGSLLLGEEGQGVDQGAPLALSHPRDCDKREEVGSRALAVCEVSRYDHRYRCRQGLPVSSKSREVPFGSGEILYDAISPSSALAGGLGPPGFAGAVGSSRSTSDALLAVASEVPVVPRVRPSLASGGFAGGSETGPVLVDGEGSPVSGGSIRDTCSGSTPVFGRVFVGLGCSPPRSKRVRGVVCPGEVVAHQSSRNEGPLPGASGFSRRCSRSPCDRDVRQLHGCGVHQQTGRHGVEGSMFVDQPPSEMTESFDVHLEARYLPGESNVLADVLSRRGQVVGTEWSLHPQVARALLRTWGNPSIDLSQREAAPVLLACPGSTGRLRGCVSSSLGRPGSLRVPSLCSGRSGDRSRPAVIASCDDSGRTSLAREGVVLRLAASSDSTTPGSTLLGQAASAAPLQPVPSRRPLAEPSRVATLKRHYRKSGFSGRAARVLSGVLRESSSRLYQSRWKIFCGWCRGRSVAPVNASVPVVVDFLIHLRQDKGLSVSAVKGYCSALNSVLALKGLDLAAFREITTLLRSFARSVNPVELRPPAWDVSLVLQSLTGAPYEPLRTCEERFLAQKTLSSYWPLPRLSVSVSSTLCRIESLIPGTGVRFPLLLSLVLWPRLRIPLPLLLGLRAFQYRP